MKNTDTSTLDKMEKVERLMQDYKPTISQTMVLNGQARYLTWDFSDLKFDTLELLQITDIQYGHKQCNLEKLTEYLDWVLAEENRYILLGGDLVDAGHKLSKGSTFEQIGDPQEEMWNFVEMFAPYRHRVLGYVGGNHERRSMDTFGDLGKSIATILQLPYSPGKQHIDINFGKHKPFKITQFHGRGAGRTKGAITNQISELMRQADSHLYLVGHLHQAQTVVDWREYRDGKGYMKLQKIVGGMGSAFLNHYGTYAEVIMAANPQGIMMHRAVLEKNGHWEVTLR
jgi:predicted MPP superfamily phosphohydrolase